MKILLILIATLALSVANEVALQEFTTGNNLFTAAIYKEAVKDHDGDFIISPFSIQTVLALTQSGAKDETANEIRRTLHLPSTTQKTESAYASLLPNLKGNRYYALHTANRIYVQKNYPIKETFKDIAYRAYQAGAENIDFSLKTQAADTISKWVEEQTQHKIRDLIDPKNLGQDTRVVLVNALYFKGKWVNPFETYATRKKDFYTITRNIVQVDTMQTTDLFNYYESPELNAKFLELPYLGEDVSMIIVLPNDKGGLRSLENQIERVLSPQKFTQERVSVSLPKFSIENQIQLKEDLKQLGISKAFADGADLSGIAGKKGDLVISDVIQKAFINVTEGGTEAAAATAVPVVTLSLPAPQRQPKYFKADHPFLFYIRLQSNNILLFAGKFTSK